MREILFRGKRVDNGEWVYGYYVELKYDGGKLGKCGFIYPSIEADYISVAVDSKTKGQYTGKTDKHDKKIFEHDIIKYFSCEDGQYIIGKIVFENLAFKIYWAIGFKDVKSNLCDYSSELLEVVGNTYDNPELLEVE